MRFYYIDGDSSESNAVITKKILQLIFDEDFNGDTFLYIK